MKSKRAITFVTAATVGALGLMAPVAFADHVPAPNDDPGFLQVYDANVENLPRTGDTCPGDWQDLVYYMKTQDLAPDLYLVQQINGSGDQHGDLEYLTARMSEEYGEEYSGIIADSNPGEGPQVCAPEKGYQTNAIIYRESRFDLVADSTSTWRAKAEIDGECQDSQQDRTVAVKAQLRDTVADKTVTAASVHWPTKASGGGTLCGKVNADDTAAQLANEDSDQVVLGGDMNITDTKANGDFRPWYQAMNGALDGEHGFGDAVYSACEAAENPADCLASNWTINGDRRIDFLMARTGAGEPSEFDGVHTPTFNEGDAADEHYTGDDNNAMDYSDHRAVQAQVRY